jgi:hypothetical protein
MFMRENIKSQWLDPKFITSYSNSPLEIEGGDYYVCPYNSQINSRITHNTVGGQRQGRRENTK